VRVNERNAPVWVTVLLVIIGVLCIAAAVVYLTEPARHLPSFFPGHEAGVARKHTKHGLAALVVGIVAFAVAWIASGRRRTA
jgi:1,4-dihydroxy-2-naphthoate octaprenyltransferase